MSYYRDRWSSSGCPGGPAAGDIISEVPHGAFSPGEIELVEKWDCIFRRISKICIQTFGLFELEHRNKFGFSFKHCACTTQHILPGLHAQKVEKQRRGDLYRISDNPSPKI